MSAPGEQRPGTSGIVARAREIARDVDQNVTPPRLRPDLFDEYLSTVYDRYMNTISLHVSEEAYQEFKSLAAREGRPVAELLRQAMAEYLSREGKRGASIFDIRPHPSGRLLKGWTRGGILDEMVRG
jgi:hypothetical protein